jgi:molybdopterin synthase catalytic subunit
VTAGTGTRIRVHIRLFAMQRELAGTRALDLELPAGATVEEAWAALVERHPVLAPGRPAVRFAVNGSYGPAETRLDDGDEVAMIPPVSGGEGGAGGRGAAPARILELRAEPFDGSILSELSARLATPEDGAVVGFLGVTRRSPGTPAPGQEAEAARHAGRVVQALTYETHPQMALAILAEIADEIEQRFGVTHLAIVHREGDVPLGAASVAIVACAPHRDAAFEAARYAIDETKARAPIWKAELFADGKVWIGEPARESSRSFPKRPRHD